MGWVGMTNPEKEIDVLKFTWPMRGTVKTTSTKGAPGPQHAPRKPWCVMQTRDKFCWSLPPARRREGGFSWEGMGQLAVRFPCVQTPHSTHGSVH